MFRPSALSSSIYICSSMSSEELQQSPMAINGMKLLRYVEHQGGIPLTQVSKNFQRKCVEWAAVEFQWPGYEPEKLYDLNKVLNELDFLPLSLLHSAFLDIRLIRHFKGRAVLTKAGKAMLGQHGELQAVLAEWILMTPHRDYVALEAMPLFWDISHMIGVISNRLHEWMSVGDLTECLIPIDLIETSGPLGARHHGALLIGVNLVRPLGWLGLAEERGRDIPAIRIEDRQVRKTPLFDRLFKTSVPLSAWSASVH